MPRNGDTVAGLSSPRAPGDHRRRRRVAGPATRARLRRPRGSRLAVLSPSSAPRPMLHRLQNLAKPIEEDMPSGSPSSRRQPTHTRRPAAAPGGRCRRSRTCVRSLGLPRDRHEPHGRQQSTRGGSRRCLQRSATRLPRRPARVRATLLLWPERRPRGGARNRPEFITSPARAVRSRPLWVDRAGLAELPPGQPWGRRPGNADDLSGVLATCTVATVCKCRLRAKIDELGLVLPAPMWLPEGFQAKWRQVRVVGTRAVIAGHGPRADERIPRACLRQSRRRTDPR